MIFVYIISGIIGGIVGGMGMGGGTLLIPLLTIVSGVEQHVAQAVNLISFIPMSAVALFIHSKKKLIKKSGVILIIISGVFSCAVFAVVAKNTDGETLKRIFGIFLIILSLIQLFPIIKAR